MRRFLVLVLLVVAACGGKDAATATFTVTDSAGIEIVESVSPAWGEAGPRIDPEPLVSIGREEEGPYQFDFLLTARLVSDGGMAVPVLGAQELRFFDASGNHVRTVGRPGDGPGEFRGLYQVFRYPGDSIAAFDSRLLRTTLISTHTGAYRSFPVRAARNFGLFGVLAGGQSLLFSQGGSYHPELEPGLQWVATDVLSVEPADGATRTIASLPGRQQVVESTGDAGRAIPELMAVQAVADDGFYWATPDRYEIGFYDGEGRLRRLLRRPVEATPMTPALLEEWIEAQVGAARRTAGDGAAEQARRFYQEAVVGEYLPFFEFAFVDAEQRLWVGAPSRLGDQLMPPRWSIFSPVGVWLGDIEAPEGVRIVDSREGLVLGIRLDELDVPHVQVHRLIE